MSKPSWKTIARDYEAQTAYLMRRCLVAEGSDLDDWEAWEAQVKEPTMKKPSWKTIARYHEAQTACLFRRCLVAEGSDLDDREAWEALAADAQDISDLSTGRPHP